VLYVRPAPTYVNARALAANTAEQVTVPGSAGEKYIAIFACSATPYYVLYGANPTATVPADTTDGTAAECNPTAYECEGGQKFSIIAPATAIVTVAFYGAAT
jgi:hypothetical protein